MRICQSMRSCSATRQMYLSATCNLCVKKNIMHFDILVNNWLEWPQDETNKIEPSKARFVLVWISDDRTHTDNQIICRIQFQKAFVVSKLVFNCPSDHSDADWLQGSINYVCTQGQFLQMHKRSEAVSDEGSRGKMTRGSLDRTPSVRIVSYHWILALRLVLTNPEVGWISVRSKEPRLILIWALKSRSRVQQWRSRKRWRIRGGLTFRQFSPWPFAALPFLFCKVWRYSKHSVLRRDPMIVFVGWGIALSTRGKVRERKGCLVNRMDTENLTLCGHNNLCGGERAVNTRIKETGFLHLGSGFLTKSIISTKVKGIIGCLGKTIFCKFEVSRFISAKKILTEKWYSWINLFSSQDYQPKAS